MVIKMSEIIIEGKGIKRNQAKKLFDLLKAKFPNVEIKRESKTIILPRTEGISKTRLRVYIKKFIHHEGEKNVVKVLSGGGNILVIHRKGGLEPVEEEEEAIEEES